MAKSSSDTIYVRIDRDDKSWLAEEFIPNNPELSEKYVVGQLIKYLRSLHSDTERLELLELGLNPLASVGAAMELMAWADHAFNLRRWEWALEAYRRLAREAGTSRGFRRLAEYKQGYCWLDIAIELRREALLKVRNSTQWDDYFDAADQAIGMSLLHNSDFLNLGEHPVVRFNKACGWGLRAQYAVEKALRWNSEWVSGRVERFSSTPLPEDDDKEWEKLGKTWRDKVSNKKELSKLEQKVMKCTHEAVRELTLMAGGSAASTAPADAGFISPPDVNFLVQLTMTDEDMKFISHDREARKVFVDWAEEYKVDEPKLTSFGRLWERLPDEAKRVQESFSG